MAEWSTTPRSRDHAAIRTQDLPLMPRMEPELYSVLQINAQGSRLVGSELKKFVEYHQIDLLCVQEPCFYRGKIIYFTMATRIAAYGDQPKAAIMCFNKNCQLVEIR